MRYQVDGADATTGKDRTIFVTATDERDAMAKAKEQGVYTTRIIELPDEPAQQTAAHRHTGQSVGHQRYIYKMVQIPPNITVREQKGAEAAAYLERVVNSHATEGWEFYRVDPVGVRVQPGCLGILMGIKEGEATYYVITFRRPAT